MILQLAKVYYGWMTAFEAVTVKEMVLVDRVPVERFGICGPWNRVWLCSEGANHGGSPGNTWMSMYGSTSVDSNTCTK